MRLKVLSLCNLNRKAYNMFNNITSWGDRHHPVLLDSLRIALGLFLLLKGIAFMESTAYLNWILAQQEWIHLSPIELTLAIHYVIFIHMAGGLLIALGILTRLSCLLQIPVLIVAMLMANLFKSPLNSDMGLATITCFLLILFLIAGSGPLSLDRYLKDN